MISRIDKDAEKIVAAMQAGELRPVLSLEAPLDLETAYNIQAKVVSRSGMAVAGFKAALSNTLGQKAMGVTEPVFGILPKLGHANAGDLINLKNSNVAGVIVGKAIYDKKVDLEKVFNLD